MGGRLVGDQLKLNTEADVVVRLLDPNSRACLIALPLHSHVLIDRSEFFAARLSQRWDRNFSLGSSDGDHASRPHLDLIFSGGSDDLQNNNHGDDNLHEKLPSIEITITEPSAAATYKQCIELMYVPCNSLKSWKLFCGVVDALAMLHVAAELLFCDCVEACTQFLEMLPEWTSEEEVSIRSSLTSLQFPCINTDLAARLSLPQGIPPDQPMCIMRRMLVQVLNLACEKSFKVPFAVKHIDASKPIPQAVVLLAWNAQLDLFKTRLKSLPLIPFVESDLKKANSLSWLLRKLLALKAADAIVQAFVEDTQLSNSTLILFIKKSFPLIYSVLSLLDLVTQAVCSGSVLLSRSERRIFILTWLPVARVATHANLTSYHNILERLTMLINSLPISDREKIYNSFMKEMESPASLESSFKTWCEMLQQFHMQHGDPQERLLL